MLKKMPRKVLDIILRIKGKQNRALAMDQAVRMKAFFLFPTNTQDSTLGQGIDQFDR
jgi:hypothetical protein